MSSRAVSSPEVEAEEYPAPSEDDMVEDSAAGMVESDRVVEQSWLSESWVLPNASSSFSRRLCAVETVDAAAGGGATEADDDVNDDDAAVETEVDVIDNIVAAKSLVDGAAGVSAPRSQLRLRSPSKPDRSNVHSLATVRGGSGSFAGLPDDPGGVM